MHSIHDLRDLSVDAVLEAIEDREAEARVDAVREAPTARRVPVSDAIADLQRRAKRARYLQAKAARMYLSGRNPGDSDALVQTDPGVLAWGSMARTMEREVAARLDMPWTFQDQALSDALHTEDIAQGALVSEYADEMDGNAHRVLYNADEDRDQALIADQAQSSGSLIRVAQRRDRPGRHPANASGVMESNDSRHASAFTVPQTLLGIKDPDDVPAHVSDAFIDRGPRGQSDPRYSEDERRAYRQRFQETDGWRGLGSRPVTHPDGSVTYEPRDVPLDVFDTMRDEEQPERFASDVPLTTELQFAVRPDGYASRSALESGYLHRTLQDWRPPVALLTEGSLSRRQLAVRRARLSARPEPPALERLALLVDSEGVVSVDGASLGRDGLVRWAHRRPLRHRPSKLFRERMPRDRDDRITIQLVGRTARVPRPFAPQLANHFADNFRSEWLPDGSGVAPAETKSRWHYAAPALPRPKVTMRRGRYIDLPVVTRSDREAHRAAVAALLRNGTQQGAWRAESRHRRVSLRAWANLNWFFASRQLERISEEITLSSADVWR